MPMIKRRGPLRVLKLKCLPAEAVVRNLSLLPVIGIDAEKIIAAIGRCQKMQLSFWDALIIETALAGGAARLLTEDLQHGQIIDGLQIENPFLANRP